MMSSTGEALQRTLYGVPTIV